MNTVMCDKFNIHLLSLGISNKQKTCFIKASF